MGSIEKVIQVIRKPFHLCFKFIMSDIDNPNESDAGSKVFFTLVSSLNSMVFFLFCEQWTVRRWNRNVYYKVVWPIPHFHRANLSFM